MSDRRPVTRGVRGDTSNPPPPTGQKGPDFDVHFYARGAEQHVVWKGVSIILSY